jgi:hypothetical protein
MNSTRVICCLLLAGCGLLATRCSSPTKIAGNSSQTPNAVVGILYQPDGKTPATGVRVHIRPQKTLADTFGTGLSKRLAVLAATDSVVTDSAGRYAFDTTLDTGTYVVEAASGNNAVLIDSVTVKNKAATDTLAPDTLKPAGALKGVIKLSEGGDPRKVFVLAFGIDRFAKVNADGSFKFAGLAEAAYDLRLISSLDNYGVLDTVGVSVRSGDTTDLDTIRLPFTGIPTPKNVRISYDTLKQIVTLTWNKADTGLVKGYNVYRKYQSPDSNFVKLNNGILLDTFFLDTNAQLDQSYDYFVRALDTNMNEGLNSQITTVKITYFVYAGEDRSYEAGDSILLKGLVNRSIITPLQYRWDANGDRNQDFSSSSADSFVYFFTDTGTFRAVFSVEDSLHNIYSDTVKLKITPSTQVIAPINVNALYDTSNDYVLITWSTIPLVTTIKGYNVYRKTNGSSYARINPALVQTTLYIDSLHSELISGETYLYRITSVNANDNESVLSIADTLAIP